MAWSKFDKFKLDNQTITIPTVIIFLAILFSIVSFCLSFLLVPMVLKLSEKFGFSDDPNSAPHRKIQSSAIPLMGATSFILTSIFLMGTLWLANKFDWFSLRFYLQNNLESFKLIWILVSIIMLAIAGALDDLNKISTKYRFLLVGLAILTSIFLGGLKISALSAPFNSLPVNILFLPQVLAFLWLGFCLFATKLLDGLDGLVSTIGIIAFFTIASISTLPSVNQPLIFLFALIWAFGIMGFLPFNFPNAKIYLGDGGSMIVGFMVGVLSILSGAKIATAATVLGWFILDVFVVWFIRLLQKQNPLTTGDRNHWHHRLLGLGMDKRQVLILTTILVIFTAQLGILLNTEQKVLIPIFQFSFILVSLGFSWYRKNKIGRTSSLKKLA